MWSVMSARIWNVWSASVKVWWCWWEGCIITCWAWPTLDLQGKSWKNNMPGAGIEPMPWHTNALTHTRLSLGRPVHPIPKLNENNKNTEQSIWLEKRWSPSSGRLIHEKIFHSTRFPPNLDLLNPMVVLVWPKNTCIVRYDSQMTFFPKIDKSSSLHQTSQTIILKHSKHHYEHVWVPRVNP